MSTIKLLSVTGYKTLKSDAGKTAEGGRSVDVEILFGAQSVSQENGALSFVCGNVDSGGTIALPEGGISLYYGFREALEETARCKRIVDALQDEDAQYMYGFHPAYINVEVGDIFREMAGLNDIEALEFASIRRVKAEVQHFIMDRMSELLSRETKNLKTLKRVSEIASHPALFQKILFEPPFDNIKVFVYPVSVNGSLRYLAFVKPDARIASVEQNDRVNCKVEWPYPIFGA